MTVSARRNGRAAGPASPTGTAGLTSADRVGTTARPLPTSARTTAAPTTGVLAPDLGLAAAARPGCVAATLQEGARRVRQRVMKRSPKRNRAAARRGASVPIVGVAAICVIAGVPAAGRAVTDPRGAGQAGRAVALASPVAAGGAVVAARPWAIGAVAAPARAGAGAAGAAAPLGAVVVAAAGQPLVAAVAAVAASHAVAAVAVGALASVVAVVGALALAGVAVAVVGALASVAVVAVVGALASVAVDAVVGALASVVAVAAVGAASAVVVAVAGAASVAVVAVGLGRRACTGAGVSARAAGRGRTAVPSAARRAHVGPSRAVGRRRRRGNRNAVRLLLVRPSGARLQVGRLLPPTPRASLTSKRSWTG